MIKNRVFLKTIILAAAVLVVTGAAVLEAQELKVRVTARRANVRASTDLKSEVVGQVKKGAVLQIDAKEGDWYLVRLPLKLEGYSLPGYIHKSVVEEVGEGTAGTAPAAAEGERGGGGLEAEIGAGFASVSGKDFGGGLALSAGLSLPLSDRIALVLRANLLKSGAAGDSERLSKGTLSAVPLELGLILRFPLNGELRPFAEAGIGYCLNSFKLDPAALEDWAGRGITREEKVENALGFYLGAGLDYPLSDRLFLSGNLRFMIAGAKGSWTSVDKTSGGQTSGEWDDLNLGRIQFSVGLRYAF
ncbi:MAG: outer membrane beta-barrel protein [Candidatus Aminicenantes bacterium]|nr:outer membrane beta-barrel protein [Candidatus Aminicenantes bacterium]